MPVSIDAYCGLSIDDVLEIEAAAVAAAKSGGGAVVAWSSAGSSVTKSIDGTPAEILRAVLYAKKYIQPDIYGVNLTRTVVSHAGRSTTS